MDTVWTRVLGKSLYNYGKSYISDIPPREFMEREGRFFPWVTSAFMFYSWQRRNAGQPQTVGTMRLRPTEGLDLSGNLPAR